VLLVPSAQKEDRIFEKFYRAGGTPSTGVGLGLTICRGIVTAHGGRIWAENRAGGGAMFRFTIPSAGVAPTIDAEEPDSSVQALEIGTPWIDQPHSSS
jgi:two-component system, OmpR family, sensor histidine kinase KdpD